MYAIRSYYGMKPLVLTIIVSLAFQMLALGQAGIKGRIMDSTLPVPDATIFIETLQKGTSTKLDGTFELHLKSGNYILTISSVGFQTRSIQVVVEDEMVDLGEITLEPTNHVITSYSIHYTKLYEKE